MPSLVVTSIGIVAVTGAAPVSAGIHSASSEVTYKEYWVPHSQFTGGCSSSGSGIYYLEPGPCTKSVVLDIPDNFSGALKAEIYIDLWRNRTTQSAQFQINSGPWRQPTVGLDYSRTPYVSEIPLNELVTGANTLNFTANGGELYHAHDIAIRIYHDGSHPLVAGPGSDVTPPTAALTQVSANGQNFVPSAGGTLVVDNNLVNLTATASGAAYVEFHGFYNGYDEDNDGLTTDWHSFNRNNWNPGGLEAKTTGGTIGHIGTDLPAGGYNATWNVRTVPNQNNVRFKVRAVDSAGNVREAAGGQSGNFTLSRTRTVDVYRIPNFVDVLLEGAPGGTSQASRQITLPNDLDLTSVTEAYLVGNYWRSPLISINDNASFAAFQGSEDEWDTSVRQLNINQLVPGVNRIRYTYNPTSLLFGQFVEKPGPMLVIHRTTPSATTAVTTQPIGQSVTEGSPVTFSVTAKGTAPLTYQWRRNNVDISGAVSSSYTISQALTSDNGAQFSVVVNGPGGSATSAAAALAVVPVGASAGPWWSATWDYRVPVTVDAGAYARNNRAASVEMNFTALMSTAGQGGVAFDPATIRVVEVDAAGTVIDADVPHQFDPATTYNAQSNASGTLVLLTEGATPAFGLRRYDVYFDRAGKGIDPATVPNQVTLTQDIPDAGFNSHRIVTQSGTWYYHTSGGGFSSLVDAQGNDWLSYSTATGATGDFRGTPNAVPPYGGGYFHPGRNTAFTSIIASGPLRVSLRSVSDNGQWATRWDIYPTYSTMTMEQVDGAYWFLYEGTPGGAVNSTTDMVVRPNGTQTTLGTSWAGDIGGDEWVYFADGPTNRSLFVANSVNDGQHDEYYLMNNAMTVMGFGRNNTGTDRASLTSTSAVYSIGLVDSKDFNANKASILSASRSIGITLGVPTYDGTFAGPYTDSFNTGSLDPRWTIVDPRGTTTVALDGNHLVLDLPAGPTRDWATGRNWAPRVLQPTPNIDLDLVLKMDSTLTQFKTFQGFLFQEDNDDGLTYRLTRLNATTTRLEGQVMMGGTVSSKFTKNLTGTTAPLWLRVTRSGTTWWLRYSTNGTTWFTAKTFTHTLNVTASGVIAGSHKSGTSPALQAQFDFFQNLGEPVNPNEGPTISGLTVDPASRSAVVTYTTSEPADGFVDYGLTVALGQVATGALDATNHSITLSPLACNTTYFMQARAVDVDDHTGTSSTTFTTDPCPVLTSDDFSSTTLNPMWSFVNPVGDATLSLNGTQAVISIPGGVDHNLWGGANRAPRLVQEAPDGDFEIEAKFETAVVSRYQMLGLVFEQDSNDFLRFEVHHNGTGVRAYAANITNGSGVTAADVAFTPGTATYVRVTRSAANWTFQVSANGTDWTNVTTIVRSFQPTVVGPYVGTTANSPAQTPAFTAAIDYAFNTASPIDPEDGVPGGDTTPPVISNVQVNQVGQVAVISWTTDEPADSTVNYGATAAVGITRSNAPLVTNHSVTTGLLLCGSTVHYRVRSSDAADNEAVSTITTFATTACPTAVESDDFSAATVNARWTELDPLNVGTVSLITGTAARIQIPAGNASDITGQGNNGVRLLQPYNNTDLSVEVKYESPVTQKSQMQGLVFEQDDNTLIRFDMFHNGSGTRLFVGKLTSGGLASWKNTAVTLGSTTWLRAVRTGNSWTFEYSTDGTAWTVFHGPVTDTIAVRRLGPWVGTGNASGAGTAPGLTSQIDYFFNTNAPIVPEDPGGTGANPTVFDVYNGNSQKFGNVGTGSNWVNILGAVSDVEGVSSLSYTLNNGPLRPLSIGPDLRRLVGPGSFNADIPRNQLAPGTNTVVLRAVDTQNNVTTNTVTIDYQTGNVWPLPYSIDWDTVTNIQDVAEVVDGNWEVSGGTVSNVDVGYDRVLAVGDVTWTDYEVTVPFTINSIDPNGYGAPSNGPLVGIITHWNGHYQTASQPYYGFKPIGGFGNYHWTTAIPQGRLELANSDNGLMGNSSLYQVQPGVPFMMKMQVKNTASGPTYGFKMWPQSVSEPGGWTLSGTDALTAPTNGTLLIVAHHVDASFGDVTVTPVAADPVAAPVITPAGGNFGGQASNVTMTTATAGAVIRYTVDGNEPTQLSDQYVGPINIVTSATVKAKAFKAGLADSATTTVTFTISPSVRTFDALEAAYDFNDGSGTTVTDQSGKPDPVNLTVEAGSSVTWLSGGIRLDSASRLRSSAGVTRIRDNIAAANAFTMEMWVKPTNNTQNNVQMMTISANSTGRNVSMLQFAGRYQGVVRTASTSLAGTSTQMSSATIAASPVLDHVVMTRDSSGLVTWYLNGVQTGTSTIAGALSNWDNYRLVLGSENGGGQAWLGEIHYAAIYSKALSAGEVSGNFSAGSTL